MARGASHLWQLRMLLGSDIRKDDRWSCQEQGALKSLTLDFVRSNVLEYGEKTITGENPK